MFSLPSKKPFLRLRALNLIACVALIAMLGCTGSGTPSTSPAAALSIAIQPASQSIYVGDPATFSVVAGGTPPFTYQWLRGSTTIPGANSSSYTLATVGSSDNGSTYAVQVANSSGSTTSAPATLTVTAKPVSITTQPAGAVQFAGETAVFSVAVTGTSPTFQWRKNAAAIAGATSATYTTPVLTSTDDNTAYDVVISNAAGTVTSNAATLRIGPFATSYKTQQGKTLTLYAWPGTKNAILTKTASLDVTTMRKMMSAADGTWNYYASAVGTLPYFALTYSGAGAPYPLATIAVTGVAGTDLCGDGCTYIGATGMELSDNAFAWLYSSIQSSNAYDQVMFYEFGRSFWLFNNQIGYKLPDDFSCEVTGYAVLMRYRSILAQGLTGSYAGTTAAYTRLYNTTLPLIDAYAANSSQNFGNIFLTTTSPSPNGSCPDLWASMVLRLASNYGGEGFIQSLFKEILKRPAITSTQDGIDNFVLAASAAAGKNLTFTFGTTWKWPISVAATNEARTKYGSPQ